eukprot:g16504.t1
MDEEQQRPASRRFWEEGPVVAAAPISLSPPLQQQQQQQKQQRRDVNISNSCSIGLDQPSALQGVSRVKISAAAGGGGADAHGEVKQGSSELSQLPFTVEDVSYSCPDGPASSLEEPGRTSCWKGGAGDSWVLLRLNEKALLSFLRVCNRSTSEISMSISVRGKRRRDFVEVKRGINLAHGTVTNVKIGHLPCVYIRLDCRSRGASGVSLHELAPVGIPTRCVGLFMGPCMEDLTYKSTERLLFGPSLKTSLAPVCSSAALKRLVLPPSFLRPEGASYDTDDPDPVRRGPPSGTTLGAHALLHRHQSALLSPESPPLRPPPPLPPPPPPPGVTGRGDTSDVHGRPFLSFPGAGGGAGAADAAQYFRGGAGNFHGLGSGGGGGGNGGGIVSFGDRSSPGSYAFVPQRVQQQQQQQPQSRRRQRSYSSSSGGRSASGAGSVCSAGARTGGGVGGGGEGGGGGGRFPMASGVLHPPPHEWSYDDRHEDRGGGDDDDDDGEEEEKGEGGREDDERDNHPLSSRSRQPERDSSGSGYREETGMRRSSTSYSLGRRRSGGGSRSGSNFGSAYGGSLRGNTGSDGSGPGDGAPQRRHRHAAAA